MTIYGARDATEPGDVRRCRWCRHVLTPHSGPGRPKEFCRQSCRQWDWVARQRAQELALSENELVVAREELDDLKDRVYVLQCALEDAKRDLSGSRLNREAILGVLEWVMSAAEPVAAGAFGPRD